MILLAIRGRQTSKRNKVLVLKKQLLPMEHTICFMKGISDF